MKKTPRWDGFTLWFEKLSFDERAFEVEGGVYEQPEGDSLPGEGRMIAVLPAQTVLTEYDSPVELGGSSVRVMDYAQMPCACGKGHEAPHLILEGQIHVCACDRVKEYLWYQVAKREET